MGPPIAIMAPQHGEAARSEDRRQRESRASTRQQELSQLFPCPFRQILCPPRAQPQFSSLLELYGGIVLLSVDRKPPDLEKGSSKVSGIVSRSRVSVGGGTKLDDQFHRGRRLLSVRLGVLDNLYAPLQIGVSDGAIEIECRLLDVFVQLKIQ